MSLTDKSQTHYYEEIDAVCGMCTKPIIGACISALGKKFHRTCFICSYCQKLLASTGSTDVGFRTKNEKAYCKKCFQTLF